MALASANAPEWAVWWFGELTGADLHGLAGSAADALRQFVVDAEWRERAMEYAEWEREWTPYTADELHDELRADGGKA